MSASDAPCGVLPVEVNVEDLVTKAYGILGYNMNDSQAEQAIQACFDVETNRDEGRLWLDSDGGFRLSYSGMQPEMSAMAEFAGGRVSDYAYFFIFPVSSPSGQCLCSPECHCHDCALKAQSGFCGAMLQEMYDTGMEMGAVPVTDALFQVTGEYQGRKVDMRLVEDSDRYVVVLEVEPRAFTETDALAAL